MRLGGLSVASDGLKAVLPVVVAHQVAARHWGRAMAGVVIFPLVLGYGFMSALGFASQSRGVLVAGRGIRVYGHHHPGFQSSAARASGERAADRSQIRIGVWSDLA